MPTSTENVVRFPVRVQCEPSGLQSIDLNRIRRGSAFIATSADGTQYRVARDPFPARKDHEDPAMAYVLITQLVTGEDSGDKIVADEQPMYAHSILAVGKQWRLDDDDTDTIISIVPVAGA